MKKLLLYELKRGMRPILFFFFGFGIILFALSYGFSLFNEDLYIKVLTSMQDYSQITNLISYFLSVQYTGFILIMLFFLYQVYRDFHSKDGLLTFSIPQEVYKLLAARLIASNILYFCYYLPVVLFIRILNYIHILGSPIDIGKLASGTSDPLQIHELLHDTMPWAIIDNIMSDITFSFSLALVFSVATLCIIASRKIFQHKSSIPSVLLLYFAVMSALNTLHNGITWLIGVRFDKRWLSMLNLTGRFGEVYVPLHWSLVYALFYLTAAVLAFISAIYVLRKVKEDEIGLKSLFITAAIIGVFGMVLVKMVHPYDNLMDVILTSIVY